MANTVRIMIRAKLDGKYPYLPVVWAANGRLKPGRVILSGKEIEVEGTYHLRYTENRKRTFELVGTDPAEAVLAAKKKAAFLEALSLGIIPSAPTEVKQEPSGLTLAEAIAAYKAEIKEHKAQKTYKEYAFALDLFEKSCKKTHVDEVGRGCMMAFIAAIRKDRIGRTIHKLTRYVYTFLLRHGKKGILNKTDWPKVEEREYEIYSEDDVRKMIAACRMPEELALILFASCTGFRKMEIAHAEVGDVDFRAGTVKTESKPQYNWTTKDHEQRIIKVADSLLAALRPICGAQKSGLLFSRKAGGVNIHLDRIVVRVAKRAGVKVPKKPCHAFRALHATMLVRAGVDIYTVQRRLGHSDIETTQRYLRAMKREDPRLAAQVNAAGF
jgi:integrase/recombinase XerD